MTTTYKVIDNYARYRDGELANLSNRVLDRMTNNTTYPSPTPTLAMIQQALQDYQAVFNKAPGGDLSIKSEKNDKRLVLENQLSQLAGYVNTTANGDKTKLLTSGFPLVRKKANTQKLGSVDKLTVNIDTPTQAVTRIKKVIGAKSYVHQYTTDAVSNDAKWTGKTTTENSCTITNLQTGVKYMFRVIAVGPNDQEAYSPVMSRIIQ